MAGWQSGYAEDCKSLYAGSIPTPASILNVIKWLSCKCPGGGIGRHKGLKIPRRKLRAGSSPAPGTNYNLRKWGDFVETVPNIYGRIYIL